MNKWQVEYGFKTQNPKLKVKDLIKILLLNRGIRTEKEIERFLSPQLSDITVKSVAIDKKLLEKAVKRIKKAITTKEKIIIYGDYDADGVCASAILWETFSGLKGDVLPFIPSRFQEGYGLSKEGIDTLLAKQKVNLIITVDNGIVANEAVEYANSKGIDVIVTDHHTPLSKLPAAFSIVHTVSLCGAGVAFMLAKEFVKQEDDHLELAALATIADLVPLTKANRTFVYHGLKALRKTLRPGLLALLEKAKIKKQDLGVYEIGHIIAPRINAMGRLEDAMDSLRLICTTNRKRAQNLAKLLSETNLQRQRITLEALEIAKTKVKDKDFKKLIFIADESFAQGIVGLIAGRLVEEYYLPSIVISKGEKFSKASARSVRGFNITEFLTTASDLLVDVGGHPMAAGFTVETQNLELLEKKLLQSAEKLLKKEHLQKSLRIDLELPQEYVLKETYDSIQKLSPFGMANPEPTFLTRNLLIEKIRLVGNDGKHLKLDLKSQIPHLKFNGIAFGIGNSHGFKIGDRVDVVYTLSKNNWNNNVDLQLKIKDLRAN